MARLVIAILLAVTLAADSAVFSKPVTVYHFNQKQHYWRQAAHFELAQAQYYGYQQHGDKSLLEQAAQNNHVEASYQFYLSIEPSNYQRKQLWLKQAIKLGSVNAKLAYLQQLVEEKKWQAAQTFYRQHQRDLTTENINQEVQLALTLISAGLTHSVPRISAGLPPPVQAELTQQDKPLCELRIQPVIEKPSFGKHIKKLENSLNKSSVGSLAVCFNKPKVVAELHSICSGSDDQAISCSVSALANTVKGLSFSQLLVMTKSGGANTRGGLMFLSQHDKEAEFIHEFSHWLGFVDEYKIKKQAQKQYCQYALPFKLAENVFVADKAVEQTDVEQFAGRALYKTNTCLGTRYQAYKWTADISHMQALDIPMSTAYAEHMKNQFAGFKVVPAAMNFALFYKENEPQQYQYWLDRAVQTDFSPALRFKGQQLIDQGRFLDGGQLIEQAAEQGDATAQVLMGHGYLEGRWLPRDLQLSAHWYQQAALQNDPYGLHFLGKCYQLGWGCIQSKELANSYLELAQQAGLPFKN